jgi:hypothetical protein
MEWRRYDYKDKATWPTESGAYRVMVSGNSESCDGYTVFEYPDYPTWADVFEDEDDDGKPCLRFNQGPYAEEPETFFAYCGPFAIPPLPENL